MGTSKGKIMKIAIPVKMNKENAPLSPLFGKAKWFAIVEDGTVRFAENLQEGGKAVIEWLLSQDIDTIIFQEMGNTPYAMIKEAGSVNLFHAGYERVLLNDILEKFNADELVKIDDSNIGAIIERHKSKHTHGAHH